MASSSRLTQSSLDIAGSTSGVLTQQTVSATGTYTVTWPSAQGSSGQTLQNDGAGNLSWVDSSSAIHWKQSCRIATTSQLVALSGLAAIDGITPIAGDRILVKNGTTANPTVSSVDNGIYIAAAGAWTRSSDMEATSDATGSALFVNEGTVNSDTAWVQINEPAIVGTDPLQFGQFGSTTPASGNTGDEIGRAHV